jgi:hypothetical protein
VQTREDVVTTCHGRFRIERGYDPSVRVPDFTLKCVGFVGEVNHRDANGVSGDLNATGFFVSVPCTAPELVKTKASSVYFVTAKHVANDLKGKEFYFLVNKIGGGTLAIESIVGNKWWLHPTDKTADVAVAHVSGRAAVDAEVISVLIDQLATPERIAQMDIGIGDEVYTTGLFTPAPGIARNVPIVRHGNIAMMPGEQIQTELGYADVYLIEARSIGGLSGSPVFARPTIRLKLPKASEKGTAFLGAGDGTTLLGLMHGHWDIREEQKNKAFYDQDRKHGVNMGIGIVVPATKILETINQGELVAIRTESERRGGRNRMVPGADSAKPEKDEATFTKDDFETALKKASRRVEPSKS